jgi:glyoxylase-like metal-dependent hydrolase (beta-lactamase superfamily II)/rhodanese-related sulfurtransferase
MKVEQIYTNCLAEAAYYIESEGEAIVIDPMRESYPYLERAEKDGAKIKYILETHFHADFVSGHIDLAKKSGATIVYGPTAKPSYEVHIAEDGEELSVGKLKIRVLHTPGHTVESTTYLLLDKNGKEQAIFTGDTLFIGDVGRPDLAVKSDLSQDDLAGMLFDSLRNKIMTLPPEITVYPAHGAGSACGKNLSTDTTDTLGNQLKFNYALRASMTREEFIAEVTDGLMAPPQYFPKNAVLNKEGYDSLDEILDRSAKALSLDEFKEFREQGALILDTRSQAEYVKAHVPKSMFVGRDGTFASWVGTLVEDLRQPIVLIAEDNMEEEVVTRLSRVGYDNVLGHLEGGFSTWEKSEEVAQTESISAESFKERYDEGDLNSLDVRKTSEYETEHVLAIENFPLDFIHDHIAELDASKKYHVHCLGGYRSVIACSIMEQYGIENTVNIEGGYKAVSQTGLPLSQFQEQNTAL